MLTIKNIFIGLILLTTLQLCAQSEEDFVIVRQDERITLYERWAFFPGTTVKARQIKGVFQCATTLDKMFVTITNEEKVKEWQKNLVEHKHIPQDDSTWSAYSLYDIPWPLANQDYYLQYTVTEKSKNRLRLSFRYLPNETLEPLRKDVDRMPTIGTWGLENSSNGKINVTYIVTSTPVSYPRFITDGIVRNNFMNTLNKLISVAEK